MTLTTTTTDEDQARQLDEHDPMSTLRDQFHIPPASGGPFVEAAYMAGSSLGLQPRSAARALAAELETWAQFGVAGHEHPARPWMSYHELLRAPTARLTGALPAEVALMNSLTVNLHLLMVSFYRPTTERHAILIEDSAFNSDSYAVRSQAAFHGYDPDRAVIRLRPRPGEDTLRSEDVIDYLNREGHRVALVLLGGVNYYTGELLDIPAITLAAQAQGAVVGWDLAHAAGNVPLRLHDWNVDFAAWCSYKYLNGGPGGIAGAFVHERHLDDTSLPKFNGWWGTDPKTRFEMRPGFDHTASADSWQLSNTSIMAAAPVLASLRIFDDIGMEALRGRSVRLTNYLEALLDELCRDPRLTIITPREPAQRGAQISVRIKGLEAEKVRDALRYEHGVYTDDRKPDVIRFAPVPLYNTFHDCWRAAAGLADVISKHSQ
ncbi:MAG: kynureninase [Amycolatopsis sp.]|nr:kynureninase [Amycolatopsis sp.]